MGTALRVSRSSVPSGVAKRRLRAVRPAARPHKEERHRQTPLALSETLVVRVAGSQSGIICLSVNS